MALEKATPRFALRPEHECLRCSIRPRRLADWMKPSGPPAQLVQLRLRERPPVRRIGTHPPKADVRFEDEGGRRIRKSYLTDPPQASLFIRDHPRMAIGSHDNLALGIPIR